MQHSGPQLDQLTHWLTECPSEFYQLPIDSTLNQLPRVAGPVPIDAAAIVADHLRDMQRPEGEIRQVALRVAKLTPRQQRLVVIAVWLLREPWFLQRPDVGPRLADLLSTDLSELADAIQPETTVTDPDRREELARWCLSKLDFRPEGESLAQAQDRLKTLDSAERLRVVSQTREAEARARAIRRAMAEQRAREAATRYSPE